MKLPRIAHVVVLFCTAVLLPAQESNPAITIKALKDRAERGTVSDLREIVRGDSGKWSDAAMMQHAPSLEQKPQGKSLDDWMDDLAENSPRKTAVDENWLLFRTGQLDDNDRVWVEKIERRGNEFTVVLNKAIWQGKYFKTFTYYEVVAVNLGKLPPGDYNVKWVVQPMTFKQLEKPAQPNRDKKENWPMDEQPGGGKSTELKATFSVR
jgi:hypothetical protein